MADDVKEAANKIADELKEIKEGEKRENIVEGDEDAQGRIDRWVKNHQENAEGSAREGDLGML